MAIDFEAEGLLEGLEGKAREARRELLEELAAGWRRRSTSCAAPWRRTGSRCCRSSASTTPAARATRRAEVAEKSGLDVEFLARQRHALGLPAPDPAAAEFTDEDLEAARRSKADPRRRASPTRRCSRSRACSGLAMSQVATTNLRLIADGLLQPGDTELDGGDALRRRPRGT